MAPRFPMNVLFLCTGNTARSILCEAVLNHVAPLKFRAFSAGSHPKGEVNPYALEALKLARIPAGEPRSKSWEEFAAPGAPEMDFVITVCDSAAGEVCPIWPGQPLNAHWSYPDPAAVEGTHDEKLRAFQRVLHAIKFRLDIFANLRFDSLDRMALKKRMDDIGATDAMEAGATNATA